ncbi:MAG: putative lipid flippase MurJ [Candidatus Hydrogenedentes bacterium]|nr:putative lipid flippase MurJ [Candidatus Hydrogenedentota bacterium]
MLSRVSGLIRDMVWFATIPAASLGPFIVAFKFPNMLRDLIGEGASNAALVPVFSESIEKNSPEEHRELLSAVMSAMLIVLIVLTLLGVLLLPFMLSGLNGLSVVTSTESVSPERTALISVLAQWTFPYLFFIGMAVFSMGALFTVHHYSTPSWAPALLNVCTIGSCLLLRDRFAEPAYALVIGVWLGGLAQMTVQYVAMGKHTGVWLPNFHLRHPAIRRVFWLLIPVLLGQSAGEVNKMVDTLFAAVLGDDKVNALYMANRLIQLPLSVFGLAVTASILPTISRAGARKEYEEIRQTLIHGLRQTFFLVFPAMLGLIVLREPLIRLLFQRGEFTANDVQQSGTALLYYSFGLLAFVWVKITASGFYAVQNTKTPVIIASASMLLNILLIFVLVGPMGYRGLALATTISFTVNFILLYAMLCERFGNLWDKDFLIALGRMTLIGVMMAAVTYGTHFQTLRYFKADAFQDRLVQVLVPVTCAVAVYAVLSYALGVPDMRHFTSLFRRRTRG